MSDPTPTIVPPPPSLGQKVAVLVQSVVTNPGVRKAALALLVAILGALGYHFTSGCAPMTPAQQVRYDRIKCEIHALEPAALADADALVQEFEDGKISADELFKDAQLVQEALHEVKDAFQACTVAYPMSSTRTDLILDAGF